MAQVTIYTGTSRSGRSRRIDRMLAEAPESTRLIVPTQRLARQRSQGIAQEFSSGGFLGRPVVTFQEFASSLLKGTPDDLPLVSRTKQHLLIQNAVEDARSAGLLDFLGDAAGSPGFLHHIQHVIAQLKQSAVEPDAFRERVGRRERPSAFDRVVVEIYTNYQNALLLSQTFDLQGMYWLADLACRDSSPRELGAISTLLIDGFDDFTPSEFRLIESLSGHVEHLVFGLNYDSAPERRDAYALLGETHRDLMAAFSCEVIDSGEDLCAPASACEQVVESLFWRNASDLKRIHSGLRADLTLMPCHTVADEVARVAQGIKRRIVEEGVSPSDVLVVFKNAAVYGRILEEVFGEAGIPLQAVQAPTLRESSYADLLVQIYEATASWEREGVLHVLTSREFQSIAGSAGEHVSAYRHVAYRAGIIEGSGQWKANVHRLSERLLERQGRTVENWLGHVPALQAACESLIGDLDRLERLTEGVPSTGRFSEHLEGLSGLHGVFGLEGILEATGEGRRDLAFHAWHEIQGLIHSLRGEGGAAVLSRRVFVRQIRELFELVSLPRDSGSGGVLCLGLEDARHIEASYVYCLGMNEGTMPSAASVSAIYSEGDYRDLETAGLDLNTAKGHGDKERLLFLRLFSIARAHLTLSWYESTQQGQVVYASPFVQDIRDLERVYGLPLEIDTEATAWPMSRREAVRAGVAAKGVVVPGLDEAVRLATGKAGLERGRYAVSAFDAYDGVLDEAGVVETVAGYFDTQHRFSANQIETYIDCPFRFMMNKVLEIPSLDTPERGLSAMLIGNIYHDVLEAFYRGYRGQALEDVNLDEAVETVQELAGGVFLKLAGGFAEAYPGVGRVELSRIVSTLQRHVQADHEAGSEGWLPEHFEVTFGEALTSHSDSLSTAEVFSLEVGDVEYRFTGRIDRVDLNAERTEARLVDYKSSLGGIAKKDIMAGKNVQLTLYAMAVGGLLLPDVECAETQYLRVGNHEKVGTVENTKSEAWANARASLEESIGGIQSGVFHPNQHEKACKYCPSNKVCRFEEGRIAGKSTP